jgi:hypothetical protein
MRRGLGRQRGRERGEREGERIEGEREHGGGGWLVSRRAQG